MKVRSALWASLSFMVSLPAAVAQAQTPTVAPDLVIEHVQIVDTHTGAVAHGRTIEVTNGVISGITSKAVEYPSGAQVVDGAGAYVVPGFTDVHVHATETAAAKPSFFPLLVANGVTTIREESVTPALKALASTINAEADAGQRIAPKIRFQDGEQHLDPRRSARDQARAGKPSIDHLGAGWGLVLDCSSDEDAIRRDALKDGYHMPLPPPPEFVTDPRAFDGVLNAPYYQRIIDTFSDQKCRDLAQIFIANHTWQTVTLIRLKTQDYANEPAYRDDPRLRYVDPTVVAHWRRVAELYAELPPAAIETFHRYYALQLRVTKLMSDAGVGILAGSDSPGVWVLPGFGLHDEFKELASAGLTPLQVLQSTTLTAARFLGRDNVAGSVAVGKEADLVLLSRNPVERVDNLDSISAVVLRGRYLPRSQLARMKADAAALAAKK